MYYCRRMIEFYGRHGLNHRSSLVNAFWMSSLSLSVRSLSAQAQPQPAHEQHPSRSSEDIVGTSQSCTPVTAARSRPQTVMRNLDANRDRFSNTTSLCSSNAPIAESHSEGKPNWTQLNHVALRVCDALPEFFHRQPDMTIYREDVVFDNRLHKTEIHGIRPVWLNLACIGMFTRVVNMHVRMDLLSCLPMLEEGVVRVRWRVVHLSFWKYFYCAFFKYMKFNPRSFLDAEASWYDGYAILHVGSDGFVYRLVVDRVHVDEQQNRLKPGQKFAEKLANAMPGLTPKPNTSSSKAHVSVKS